MTALLVLAIGASSALVFTNRVELLKLAVILALWAAVVAAFVSVIYRRQSDVDQARVRDLKLVYDLQLDREISARREYELTVESQLRRELASELRAQAADEVAALRAELAALRTNLEILFDAELSHRPALETERTTVRSYSEWERQDENPRDRFDRVTSLRPEEAASRSEDRSIIDVPEEPLLPPRPAAPEPPPNRIRPPRPPRPGAWGFALAANRRNRRQPLVAAGATTRAA
ncbi:putative conserved transmembrane protein rich in alanine, arginine and proline [Mycobacterium xenopi 3993]|nr:putative conserved transmembrane protein rich in alanine, arginine and proline [Mycobacterium xenopi 3993]